MPDKGLMSGNKGDRLLLVNIDFIKFYKLFEKKGGGKIWKPNVF